MDIKRKNIKNWTISVNSERLESCLLILLFAHSFYFLNVSSRYVYVFIYQKFTVNTDNSRVFFKNMLCLFHLDDAKRDIKCSPFLFIVSHEC